MSLWRSQLVLCFVSAKPEVVLNKLIEFGVILLDVTYMDPLTVEVRIHKSQHKTAAYVLEKHNGETKSVKEEGLLVRVRRLLKRPLLVLGIVAFAVAAAIVPGRIYFITVSGNVTIPAKMLIAEAENAGIRFGCRSKNVRSEEVKNQMLSAMPDLQWIGINTSGCVATIHVQERNQKESVSDFSKRISHVVAARDGTITEMIVQKGTPLAVTGQAVNKGDMLVSGYTDCGLTVIALNAQAEIMAHTMRSNTFITPLPTIYRGDFVREHTCYRLRIGKKVINFCNHSGIPDTVCVKMYSEDYCVLPGGFQLPVSLTKIKYLHYMQTKPNPDFDSANQWLPTYAKKYLQNQMIAGQVFREDLTWNDYGDYCQLIGVYACHEMIGQVKYEEITK